MSESYKKLPRIDVDVPMPKTTPPRESPLPAWESVKKCPKCGEERSRLRYRYCEQRHVSIEKNGGTGVWTDASIVDINCPRCGHSWQEQPKDATDG